MEWPLETWSKRALLLAICALVAMIFCYEALQLELAHYRIWSVDILKMKSATALEPGYAEYWDRVGRFLQFELDEPDVQGSLAYYTRAVQLSPLTANYWTDLAVTHENLGEVMQAREDFARALDVYPESAEVHWQYANFLLRQGQIPDALAEMRTAVTHDPSLLPIAIDRAWRSTLDVDKLADAVLPPEPAAYIEALSFFALEQNLDAGLKIWGRLVQLHQPLVIDALFPFLDALIYQNRGQEAEHVWLEALAACGLPQQLPQNGSVIWNGSFEQDVLNGGFDWRIPPGFGMTFTYDTSIYHDGHRSLRISFDGGINLHLKEPFQFVPVEPDRDYYFEANVRTEDITTESGLRFYVFDPANEDAIHLETQNLTGTHSWTALVGDIRTGPNTHILRVVLWRPPSRLFESKLGGTAWIDDVSLVPTSKNTSFTIPEARSMREAR